MRTLRRIWSWLSSILLGRRYRVERCEDVPDSLDPASIYVVGEAHHDWHLVMTCPCGCNAVIFLNLLPETRPCWTYKITKGNISIHPSVWRTAGCRSHFWVREGRIQWAN